MSCIAGVVEDDGTVYMGADALGSQDDDFVAIYSDMDKLFRKRLRILLKDGQEIPCADVLVGISGTARFAQLLRYCVDFGTWNMNKLDAKGLLIQQFIPLLIEKLRGSDHLAKEQNGIVRGYDFLVGFCGKLFYVDSVFAVHERADKYIAIGSGEYLALGSLHTTQLDPAFAKNRSRTRIETALSAAAKFCSSVGEPFIFDFISNPLEPKFTRLK